MKEYREIVAALQVGTRKIKPPETPQLPKAPGIGPERKLLLDAGIASLMLEAGVKSPAGFRPIPEAPAEDGKVATRSAEPLKEAIDLDANKAIFEWAEAAAKKGLVAPYQVLPNLLELARKSPATILPVLGSRGSWLAQVLDVELPQTGEHPFLLRRQADPREFREWLGAELSNLELEERQAAVTALRSGLSLADEPILELALKDKRKEVRILASEILAALPGSRVSQEILALADQAIHHEKSLLKEKLSVELLEPEAYPAWVARRIGAGTGSGPKAEALMDLLRLTPPGHWTARFRTPPQRFLELAGKTNFHQALLDGVSQAALLFGEQEWIDQCFALSIRHGSTDMRAWPEIARRTSEQVFDDLITESILRNRKWEGLVLYSLYHRDKTYSPRLTGAIVRHLSTGGGELAQQVFSLVDPSTAMDPDIDLTALTDATLAKWRQIVPLRHRLLSSLNP